MFRRKKYSLNVIQIILKIKKEKKQGFCIMRQCKETFWLMRTMKSYSVIPILTHGFPIFCNSNSEHTSLFLASFFSKKKLFTNIEIITKSKDPKLEYLKITSSFSLPIVDKESLQNGQAMLQTLTLVWI